MADTTNDSEITKKMGELEISGEKNKNVAPQLTISIVESEASRDEEYEETNVTDATQLSDDHINKGSGVSGIQASSGLASTESDIQPPKSCAIVKQATEDLQTSIRNALYETIMERLRLEKKEQGYIQRDQNEQAIMHIDIRDESNEILVQKINESGIVNPHIYPDPMIIIKAYLINSEPRGRVIIVNNEYFETTVNLSDRDGSSYDAINLTELFEKLGFEVKAHKDLSSEDIRKLALDESTNSSHEKADAFIFIILSHGGRGYVYGTDGGKVELEPLFSNFDAKNCPALKNKPKIFIIQACQGNKEADGGNIKCDSHIPTDYDGIIPEPDFTHEKADFVFAFSTVSDYKSFRTKYGTWFVRDFINTVTEIGHHRHLLDIFIEANHKLSCRTGDRGQIQTMEVRNTARKYIYLLPNCNKGKSQPTCI